MEKLLGTALQFILSEYGVKETDIEIINLANEYLLNFEDEKRTIFCLRFYYGKDGSPKYSIEKEIKIDDEIRIIDDKKTPTAPPKKPDPVEKGRNFALDSLMETIQFLENENADFLKIIEGQEKGSNLELKELQKDYKDLSSRHEQLKKDYAELERRYKRDSEVSSEVAQFIKSLENKRKVTQEQIELIRNLLKEGKTQAEIVKLSNTSNGTVWRVKTNQL